MSANDHGIATRAFRPDGAAAALAPDRSSEPGPSRCTTATTAARATATALTLSIAAILIPPPQPADTA